MSDATTNTERPLKPTLAIASGALMGAADAIPGVSGGTIALIIGVYQRFIRSLSTMTKSPFLLAKAEGRAQIIEALRLLVPLGIGLLASYYLATKLLVGKAEAPGVMRRMDTAPICYGFFFGLVLLSLREPWKRIGDCTPQTWLIAALAAVCAAVFAGLPQSGAEPETWMLLLGGAGAIAVMLLPGVSGSLFLVIIGQYATVAGAVHDRNITVICVFAVGMVVGVATMVPLIKALLTKYFDSTMAALTGLMAGSLRALWPWKSNYDPKLGPLDNASIGDSVPWVIVALVLGGAVVFLLAKLEHRI